MTIVSRRDVVAGAASLAIASGAFAAESPGTSTLQPFAKGDVFVGATLLNNPADDHAGLGRILQYDADLKEKGVLWTKGTSHLVGGLSFAPDGTLWAFDQWEWTVIRVGRNGKQRPNKQFAKRPFGRAIFGGNGHIYLTEYLKSDRQPEPLSTRFPTLPGKGKIVGTGKIYEFDAKERLVKIHDPDSAGGMSGGFAVTHAVLGGDRRTLIYTSETGPRLMRYDLMAAAQKPDLRTLTPSPDQKGPPPMFFDVGVTPDHQLLLPVGAQLDVVSEAGNVTRSWPLKGFGWACVAGGIAGDCAYLGNWFTGEVVKLSLIDGQVLASINVGKKCISGIAQFAG